MKTKKTRKNLDSNADMKKAFKLIDKVRNASEVEGDRLLTQLSKKNPIGSGAIKAALGLEAINYAYFNVIDHAVNLLVDLLEGGKNIQKAMDICDIIDYAEENILTKEDEN